MSGEIEVFGFKIDLKDPTLTDTVRNICAGYSDTIKQLNAELAALKARNEELEPFRNAYPKMSAECEKYRGQILALELSVSKKDEALKSGEEIMFEAYPHIAIPKNIVEEALTSSPAPSILVEVKEALQIIAGRTDAGFPPTVIDIAQNLLRKLSDMGVK